MKRIQYIISILLVGAFATGCIGNYEKINTNPYEATDEHVVADDYLIRVHSRPCWVTMFLHRSTSSSS